MLRVSYLVVGALTAYAAGAYGANVADVYQAAVVNDPVLGAAKQEYAARKEIVPQTRAALLPNVNANATGARNRLEFPGGDVLDTDPTSPTFGQRVSVPGQEYNQHSWQAQVIQPVIDVTAYYNYQSAKAIKKGAAYDYESAEQALIVRAVSAYLDVLRSQAVLDSTSAEEAAVKRQQEQVQQRFDVGLVAITDVLDAAAVYDNVVVRRIQAERDQGIFFETLYTLTGITYEEVDRLSPDLPIVNPESVDEDEWVNIALANNLTVLASRQQEIAAQRDVRARQGEHFPTVDALASYNEASTNGPSFLGGETTQRTYALQAQLPIYQGRLHQFESARSARTAARRTGTAAQRRVDREPRHTQSAARRDDRRHPCARAHQVDQVGRVRARSDADRL